MIQLIGREYLSAIRNSQCYIRSFFLLLKSYWFKDGVVCNSLPASGCNVYISFTNDGCITFEKNVSLGSNAEVIAQSGNLIIGENSHLGDGVIIVAKNSISIGLDAVIAEYVVVKYQNNGLEKDPISSSGFISLPVMIKGNDWLGLKSIVLKGVHIGQGVVAAYTLDNEHVRARSIVAGVPARQVPNR